MKLNNEHTSSAAQRRARTRSLIQLGGLLEHAETLNVFNIPLGIDLQTDPSVKNNIAALFKSFLIINDMVRSGELDLSVLTLQGLEAFKEKGLSESRPLDRKKTYEVDAYSVDELENSFDSERANDNSRSSRAQSLSAHADKLQEHSDFEKEEEKM